MLFFQTVYSNNLGVSRRKRRVGLFVASPRTSFVRLRAFHCYPSREKASEDIFIIKFVIARNESTSLQFDSANVIASFLDDKKKQNPNNTTDCIFC